MHSPWGSLGAVVRVAPEPGEKRGRKNGWFLKRQAGLRDVYFRSVGDPPGVSETHGGSSSSKYESLSLVNLARNKTKGYVSWMSYRILAASA